MRGNIIRKSLLLVLFALLANGFLSPAFPEDKSIKSFETLYATLNYHKDEEVYEFGKKIGVGALALNRDDSLAFKNAKESLDKIVYRVRAKLDMYPPEFHFSVVIYPTYKELSDAYREKGMAGKAPISFYSHKTHTIYVSLENISDRVLAHEIAHAVINAYFPTPPPGQMQEILAQFVDKHLWEE